jgi:hypothetical protein
MPTLTNPGLFISAMQLRAEMTFKNVRDLLAAEKIDVILLKGPHLGATVYDSPRERLYADLDVLVRPKDFDDAATRLLENGFTPFAFDRHDPEVQRDFKHWEYRSPSGVLVELHRWLSGHDRYPVDVDGLFARSVDFKFGETRARGLAPEDLLLHLCLHMGTSYFHAIETKHVTDIALLTKKRELDWDVFCKRAKKGGARVIVYYALMAARLQDGAVVADDIFNNLRPGFIRRRCIEKFIDPASFPVYRSKDDHIKIVKRNLLLPLMDRPGQWAGLAGRILATKLKIMIKKMMG